MATGDKIVTLDDLKVVNDKFDGECADLKGAVSAMTTAASEDEGKALKAKTISGGKVTEWEFGTTGQGLTSDIKAALLACFAHVAWIDEDGQDYYDALNAALNPPASLTGISAVYTQSGTVYTTDSLDSLKADLVVTASYNDGTTATVASTDYTLSGTLDAGTSTVTVSYGGKTTTFTVIVSDIYLYTLTEQDFSRGTGLAVTPPYYTTSGNAAQRISYVKYDVLLTGGKSYKFKATSTYDTAQMGCQFFNQTILDAVNNNVQYSGDNTYDPGWQNLETTLSVPSEYKSSPVVGVRFAFRQSTSSPVISNDFAITMLTIEEV